MRSSIARLALLSTLATAAPLVGACDAPAEPTATTGSLSLPLVQSGTDGSLYELANATFEITAADGVHTLDGSVGSPAVSIVLPPGIATVHLLDGWELRRTLPGQSIPETVPALLGTANPTVLRVLANQSSTVSFGFIVRSVDGTVNVTFGVEEDPRELAGGIRITTATGPLAPYADGSVTPRADFAVFYQLARLDSVVLADGSKDHAYFAGPFDEFTTTPVAAEFYNDPIGTLAGTIGPAFAGAYLEYHIAAKPDGTRELRGTLSGINPPFVTLDFGPYTLRADVPLGEDGFPADVFFHDDSVPFTLQAFLDEGEATMTGFLNLRHIP
jgi:hypothetical protein